MGWSAPCRNVDGSCRAYTVRRERCECEVERPAAASGGRCIADDEMDPDASASSASTSASIESRRSRQCPRIHACGPYVRSSTYASPTFAASIHAALASRQSCAAARARRRSVSRWNSNPTAARIFAAKKRPRADAIRMSTVHRRALADPDDSTCARCSSDSVRSDRAGPRRRSVTPGRRAPVRGASPRTTPRSRTPRVERVHGSEPPRHRRVPVRMGLLRALVDHDRHVRVELGPVVVVRGGRVVRDRDEGQDATRVRERRLGVVRGLAEPVPEHAPPPVRRRLRVVGQPSEQAVRVRELLPVVSRDERWIGVAGPRARDARPLATLERERLAPLEPPAPAMLDARP